MRHILRISLAHFAEHKLRTALTMVGIAAGVTAVVSTTILSDSIFQSFENLVTATAGDADFHVTNAGIGVPDELVEELRNVDGVASVSGVVEGFVPLADDPRSLLAIFGLDVLGEGAWRKHLPREAIEVPDELEFIANPDSIVVTRGYAARRKLGIGETLAVIGTAGPATLTIRGLIDDEDLANLFEGRIALMDLPASQLLLQKERRVDRIDVHMAKTTTRGDMVPALTSAVEGRAVVREPSTHGKRALDLLLTVRVMLGQAVIMSIIVGFLIIYHTMSVSVIQRHQEIALLRSLGASSKTLVAWLALEAVILGFIASGIGFVAAVGLGRIAVFLFGPVADSWIRLSPIPPTLSSVAAVVSISIGVGVSLIATLWASYRVLSQPVQPDRQLIDGGLSRRARPARLLFVGSTAAVLLALLFVVQPRALSFTSTMTHTALAFVLLFASFGFASAVPVLWAGQTGVAISRRRPGISWLFASASLSRNPTAPLAVVTAIVVALGWTVGNASYMASVRSTWLSWVDREYPDDVVLVTTEGALTSVTAPPFSESVPAAISRMPHVTRVESIQQVEMEIAGRPAVLVARDLGGEQFAGVVSDAPDSWRRFAAGEGVLISSSLATVTGIGMGELVELLSPSGPVRYPIVGELVSDLFGGDLGSVVLARSEYREVWQDFRVSRTHAHLTAPQHAETVRDLVNERFALASGLRAFSSTDTKQIFRSFIDAAFAGTYALVFVGFTVSFIAIINFLLANLIERRIWYQRLHAVSASADQIRGTILAEGGILGLIGTSIGVLAAIGVSLLVVFYTIPMVNGWQFDYSFPLGPLLFGVVGTLVLSVAAALLPARLATRRGYLAEVTEE